ncbi:uncharacterized protein EI90DRAFT_3152536 [Cantharellus anzutake]|uniref:uncharacterized protein n=1 Tax=Cantharellus anzutake TaxID=1750568 RepID=UPI001908A7EC|nr:uncharacterized protein EI90DRAFT_3152536 [Cantharellus anzutake]KAF8336333.1 hypothetical protein EI90DRAFT_3152536 [Cantharellus anzutake]
MLPRVSLRAIGPFLQCRRNIFTSLPATASNRASKFDQPSFLDALSENASQFKTYKPVTPGLRHLRRPISEHLYTGPPIGLLTIAKRKKGGRNNQGRITVRHRGGGHKRRIRIIDFTRVEPGVQDVIRIEFDPGRSAHIALIKHRDPNAEQPYSYILACEGLRAGDTVTSYREGIPDGLIQGFMDPLWVGRRERPLPNISKLGLECRRHVQGRLTRTTASVPSQLPAVESKSASKLPQEAEGSHSSVQSDATQSLSLGVLRATTIRPGNVLPLRLIPTGTLIHCISLRPDGEGILVRSAGSFGTVVAHEDYVSGKASYTQVQLQSGEIRKVPHECCATVGRVSNPNWKDRSLGKAGRARNLGWRPSVRGVAMNAIDHPQGGGRGKSKGNSHPRSVWGWLTKGKRTRRPGPKGNTMVVKQRPRGKEKRQS